MPLNNAQIQTAYAGLAAADATKTLITGVSGKIIRLVSIGWVWKTAAAQVVQIKNSSTGTVYLEFPASFAANLAGQLDFEVSLPAGEGLVAVPAHAGPAAWFVVRYQVD